MVRAVSKNKIKLKLMIKETNKKKWVERVRKRGRMVLDLGK